jgi:hypothetical protein
MSSIEVVEGDIQEVVTTIFDDYLFDVDGAKRALSLQEYFCCRKTRLRPSKQGSYIRFTACN